jgi:DNA polymerase-3 subunit epsilon
VAKWLPRDALSFDVETTGVDVFNDRIVTACAVLVGKAGARFRGRWLLNPGVPIPAEATAIHGITDEKARQDGVAPEHALPAVRQTLNDARLEGLPLIIMNSSFDLTLLQAELERYEMEPLVIGPVLDPLVIDRALDPYRKGKRTLSALAQHYGVKQDGAHSSDGDALTAARIIWKQAQEPRIAGHTLEEMQAWQQRQHAEWAGQFEVYLRQQGRPEAINRDWPVRTAA